MNSALQCLCHLPQLHTTNPDFRLDCSKGKSISSDFTMMREWYKLQKEMWNDGENVIDTINILKTFMNQCRKNNIYFESFQQNDSSDFINIFMEMLHNSIKRKVKVTINGNPVSKYDELKIKGIKSWIDFFEESYSYIIQNFYSQSLTFISCTHCDYITSNFEPLMVIILTLEADSTSIYDCLDEYIKKRTLDKGEEWKCDGCHKKVCPHKKSTFWELSPVLIFEVKQYNQFHKINKHIDFPEELDMNKYCINIKNKKTKYNLSGVSIHGGSLNGGHYYAKCKDHMNQKWYTLNDSNVSETSISDVLNEDPHLFFYIQE